MPPETSDRKIFADLPRKREARKNGKWSRKEGKSEKGRWKIENGGSKSYIMRREPSFFCLFVCLFVVFSFWFLFSCFACHFTKALKFVLGLPKWEFSTGKKHFMRQEKNQEKWLCPPPPTNIPLMPLWSWFSSRMYSISFVLQTRLGAHWQSKIALGQGGFRRKQGLHDFDHVSTLLAWIMRWRLIIAQLWVDSILLSFRSGKEHIDGWQRKVEWGREGCGKQGMHSFDKEISAGVTKCIQQGWSLSPIVIQPHPLYRVYKDVPVNKVAPK